MPMFSIIMPVYNNERYFPIAVQSVLTQEYRDLELIIIDDGSADRTPQIADLIAKEDRRVRVVHQKNQWIYASLNNGIQIAKGDYVYIVNSDDRLRPGSLKNMAEKIECFHPDVIWTKVLIHKCDKNQGIIEYDCSNFDKKIESDMFF
uniref:glycosyltransferase n=1 Tax=Clostridium sp. NkU-1 TaxID=1095009 RepID=UPI0006D0C887